MEKNATTDQLTWIAPDGRDDDEAGKKGHFVGDASDLRIPPGAEFPEDLEVLSVATGNVAHYVRDFTVLDSLRTLELVVYRPVTDCPYAARTRGVTIYND